MDDSKALILVKSYLKDVHYKEPERAQNLNNRTVKAIKNAFDKAILDKRGWIWIEEESIHLEGTNRLFELPEFNSLEVAKNFVNILDEKELMADMLNTGFAKDINVYIGEENEKEELKDFSVVTFKHRIGNKDLGTIGIIGPKRMDYAKVISVMKYISKKLNDTSNDGE